MLKDYLQHLDEVYRPRSFVITENGASYSDGPDESGVVADHRRIAYLDQHIRATAAALAAGISVRGYFVWSLLDNLEWTSGYKQRFGLIWVDHATGRRIPKTSYYWYRDFIRNASRLSP